MPPIRFQCSATLSQAGNTINEDLALHGPDWLLVLDGSSGLTGRRYTSGVTDAAWFVQTIGRALAAELQTSPSLDLHALVTRAVTEVALAYRLETQSHAVDVLDQPSASIALVRIRAEQLDYFVMGDCVAVVSQRETTTVLEDKRVSVFDQMALTELRSLLNSAADFAAARAQLAPTLMANRLKKNQADGYWVIAPDPSCVTHAIHGALPLAPCGELLVFSDGFGQLVEPFGLFPDYATLLRFASQAGLPAAERRLVNAAEADAECRKHLRFKKLDDYTCIHSAWSCVIAGARKEPS